MCCILYVSCLIYIFVSFYLKDDNDCMEFGRPKSTEAMSSKSTKSHSHQFNCVTYIDCKGCTKSFPSNSFLMHFAKAKICQKNYTKEEIDEMKSIAKSNAASKKKQWECNNKTNISKRKSRNYKMKKEESMKKKVAASKLCHKNNIAAYKKVLEAKAHRRNEEMYLFVQKTCSNDIVRIERYLKNKAWVEKNLTSSVPDDTPHKLKSLENKMEEALTFYESLIKEKSLKVKDEKEDWDLVANTFNEVFNVYGTGSDLITNEWKKLKTTLVKDLHEIGLLIKIRIICKGCEKAILKREQLNHLSKFKICFTAYSESELQLRNKWFKWLTDKHLYNQGPRVSKEDIENFSNKKDSGSEQSQE